jgi:hypothetical protein
MTGIAAAGAQDQLNALVGTAVSGVSTYLALLTADPSGLTTVAALSEVTTSGYSRVLMTWGSPTLAIPSVVANTNLVTFGPMTANMALAAQWLALVTSASGTSGELKFTWTMDEPEQVLSTQTVDIAAGELTISQQ